MITQLFQYHLLNCSSFPYYECEMLRLSYLKSHKNLALYLGSLSISLVYVLMHQDHTILITRGLCFNIWCIGPFFFSSQFSLAVLVYSI